MKEAFHDEQIDLINENDEVIGFTTRSEMRKKNLLHRGVAIFVFNSKGEMLFQKRVQKKDIYPGMTDLSCGGGVNRRENYETAAKRELLEELGIKSEIFFVAKARIKDKDNNTITQIFSVCHNGPVILGKNEVESFFFRDEDAMKEIITRNDFIPIARMFIKEFYKKAKIIALNKNSQIMDATELYTKSNSQ
jgi:isopentenyldiphosphate isomerase